MSETPDILFEPDGTPSFLRQFARRRAATERCELCSAELAELHSHLLEPGKRQILCACEACAVLFCGQAGGHYLRIPRRIVALTNFHMTDMQWEALMVPINLAFFYYDSASSRVIAMYPSPAGATESTLNLQAWDRLTAAPPLLGAAEADTEAVLICRTDSGVEYFLVPIDACYELAGRMRLHWRGFDGGSEARQSIAEFLSGVRSRARAFREEP